jgi:hypothetical protein
MPPFPGSITGVHGDKLSKVRSAALFAGVLLSGMALAPRARADEPAPFGRRHDVVIAGERILGVGHATQRATFGESAETSSETYVSLLGSTSAPGAVYSVPRAGVDLFAVDGLSVGGSLGFGYTSITPANPINSMYRETRSRFVATARVGYAVALSARVSLWPRLGATYVKSTSPIQGLGGFVYYAFTAEVPVIVTVRPHLHLGIGPTIDVGIAGSPTGFETSSIFRQTEIGFQGMVAGSF